MSEPSDLELFDAVRAGDDSAFERVYRRYEQRARLMAWKMSHRQDWVEEILNETWCRAFKLRRSYRADYPFLVWFGGILRNVYREHCRGSPLTYGEATDESVPSSHRIDEIDPEKIAAVAELLAALNSCLAGLAEPDARIVRLRFFDGLTLREVADRLGLPESTLREQKLPVVFAALRRCLEKKGIDFSQIFPAQLRDVLQYRSEEQ